MSTPPSKASLNSTEPPAGGPAVPGATLPEAEPSASAAVVEVPGCEVLGELGRGGMGAVFKARDAELGRELAVKVLLEEHHDDPRTVGRFREEAQIGGQLQHPGVVPIYAMGRLADGRPYFTMKLVEGRTLAALLQERTSLVHEAPRFLHIFEQICQTLAYAHSKGVIHRDLKPANVMVGAFGEVQVMDWGLAKVVKPGSVQTVRTGRAGAESQAGSVIGTPAYMAPEQACGDVDGLDARCDVFGLGAVLCEMLTGAPPYRGRGTGELLRQAARADQADAFGRLHGCGADAELIALVKACLAAEPADRPQDAAVVAGTTAAYQAGVQERLRQAELAKAAAQARAAEERKRRRLAMALAATVLLAVLGAGAGALWYQQDRATRAAADARRTVEETRRTAAEQARLAAADARQAAEYARRAAETERDVTAALDEAATLGEQAKTLTGDPAHWEATLARALSAVERADGLLRSGVGGDALRPRVDAESIALRAAERDRVLVGALDEARLRGAAGGNEGGFDNAGAAALYAEAFRKDDSEWDSLKPAEAAGRINRRAVADEMLAALDDWISLAPKNAKADRLRAILHEADPDPASFRNRSAALLEQKDGDGLRRLAFGPDAGRVPTEALVNLGSQLYERGAAEQAVQLLKEVNERRPGDFWVVFELANALRRTDPPQTEEAVRYFTAALALRPASAAGHNNLANALDATGRLDEAIAERRQTVALRPEWALGHYNLAVGLQEKQLPDDAVAELRLAVKLDPNLGPAHNNLGAALLKQGRTDEAIAEYRKAVEQMPEFAPAQLTLGNLLYSKCRYAEAVEPLRRAAELLPDNTLVFGLLGLTLREDGRFAESLAAFRRFRELTAGDEGLRDLGAELQSSAEEQVRVIALLPAVLRGEAEPASAAARLGFARACRCRRLFAAAARFYADAFAAEPELADGPAEDRSDAARAAAQAGCGLGQDAATTGAAERVRWRRLALAWLRDDLETWTKQINSDMANRRAAAAKTLQQWVDDPAFACVRDADALAKAPPDEQEASRKLWADVDALLKKAEAK